MPAIKSGDPVTWQYTVTNTGDVPLDTVVVTDDILGVITGPDSGDNANFGVLDLTEVWIYNASSTAEDLTIGTRVPGTCLLQPGRPTYVNKGLVSGKTLDGLITVNDEDLSRYCNRNPGIDIEKTTNGAQADLPNDAADPMPGLGVITGPDSGDTANFGVLDLTEVWIYNVSSTAEDLTIGTRVPGTCLLQPGRPTYVNKGLVSGKTLDGAITVNDEDLSRYCNRNPGIHIEKTTNGAQADLPNDAADPMPAIKSGDPVNWQYTVTNTVGNVPLDTVVVTDDILGVITGPDSGDNANFGVLDLTEVWIYNASSTAEDLTIGTRVPGTCLLQPGRPTYVNKGLVSGKTLDGLITVNDEDLSRYCNRNPGIDIEKTTNGAQADLPNDAADPMPAIKSGELAIHRHQRWKCAP